MYCQNGKFLGLDLKLLATNMYHVDSHLGLVGREKSLFYMRLAFNEKFWVVMTRDEWIALQTEPSINQVVTVTEVVKFDSSVSVETLVWF